ncbi:hypothetical protein ACG83_39245 [Frankia sp. R43]|nr:hypothetical protein ACG83_39245 [Frankia sp. R43]
MSALTVVAAPAGAAPPPYSSATRYVAMGDSYSSGLGGSGVSLDCGRSPQGYPTLWANAHGITTFTDVTCAGAVTEDVLANQVSGLSAQTDVATITIGGNDVGLGSLVSNCLLATDQGCAQAVQQFQASLPALNAKLDTTYAAIRQAAPTAQVYVLGYPHLFETTWTCFEFPALSQPKRVVINQGTDALNSSIAQRATQAGFQFVDAQAKFNGHARCSVNPWILPVFSLPAPLHPNADGYRYGYQAALTAATG